jgi:hypothetical protein
MLQKTTARRSPPANGFELSKREAVFEERKARLAASAVEFREEASTRCRNSLGSTQTQKQLASAAAMVSPCSCLWCCTAFGVKAVR